MKKILLATAMCAVLSFAGDDSTDLLKLATAGNATGASYELSSNEMQSVQGGSYIRIPETRTSTMYKQTTGIITEGYMGYSAKMYARRMNNGSESVWINFVQNGQTVMAYGLEANRLKALYTRNAYIGL